LAPEIVIPVAHSESRELAFWTPITDAFNTVKEAISSIFHKRPPPPDASPAIGATAVTTTEDIIPLEDEDEKGIEVEGGRGNGTGTDVRVVASVDDYGVAHLDLEGDPNCAYTTKVRIAGSEVKGRKEDRSVVLILRAIEKKYKKRLTPLFSPSCSTT
jgi:hypothetical protein